MPELCAVRGAITVEANTSSAMREAVARLMDSLLAANRCPVTDIVALFFTITPDLTAENPARALREKRPGYGHVPMLCSQEAAVSGMLPACVRVMIQFRGSDNQTTVPVYLEGATELRPDWVDLGNPLAGQ